MPHLHQGTDDAFGLAVGLGPVDLGELLADAVAFAGLDEGVAVGALVFLAVVGVGVFNLIRALLEHVVDQEMGGAVWVLSGRMSAYSSLEKSSMATNRYSLGCVGDWPLSNGRRLVSKCTSSPGYDLL